MQRERRALAAAAAAGRSSTFTGGSLGQEVLPPPRLKELPAEREHPAPEAPIQPSSQTGRRKGVRSGKLQDLQDSPQMTQLRAMVRKDFEALQHFLDAITEADPELMERIAKNKEEFFEILLQTDEKDIPPPPKPQRSPIEDEADKSEDSRSVTSRQAKDPEAEAYRQLLKQKRRVEKAFTSTTRAPHPLASLHSPYSCAVCKDTKNLMLCGACKCVRFCSRDHQRKFWPRHQNVCGFLAGCRGGLLTEVSGKDWVKSGFPKILDVWSRSRESEPIAWEIDQLIYLPRCHSCGKVPATLACEQCQSIGYCSEACRSGDAEHKTSWQCQQVRLSSLVAHAMNKGGGGIAFEARQCSQPLDKTVYEKGWQAYVKFADISSGGTSFMELAPLAQQVIIDSLSYPLSVLEGLFRAGKPLEELMAGKKNLEAHILSPTGFDLADMMKYEEWLHRAGSQVSSLELHFIGCQAPLAEKEFSRAFDLSTKLCPRCREKGKAMRFHLHRCPVAKWLEPAMSSEAGKPAFRVAYSPVFGETAGCEGLEDWGLALERIAASFDAIPLIVTESVLLAVQQDTAVAKKHGLRTRVRPDISNFSSPLALPDENSSRKDNPTGLLVWNMSFAVFEAPDAEAQAEAEDGSSSDEESETDEDTETQEGMVQNVTDPCVASPTDLPHTDRVPLPEDDPGEIQFSLKGPWNFDGTRFEDISYCFEANPSSGSFAVSLDVRCLPSDRVGTYRSPLTSRDELTMSGYMFYIDQDERWVFWIGNGTRWVAVQGPGICLGEWTKLESVIDSDREEVRFYVDGSLASKKTGASCVPNICRPLRLGAGRSESSVARFFFQGDIRKVTVRSLP